MYKVFDNPLPPELGRMFVGPTSEFDSGPPKAGDIITVRAGAHVDFYIHVEDMTSSHVQGEIYTIGPDQRHEFEDWTVGDRIQVAESAVKAIIRGN